MTGTVAACRECGKTTYVEPLHGERGGPPYCPLCAGAWHAAHGKRRRAGRVVIRAIKAFLEAGGKDDNVDKLRDCAIFADFDDWTRIFGKRVTDPLGYMEGIARLDAADIDITSELLAATLALTHPDKHPPEFKAEANRVTQALLALKPFVFPAPKPKPVASPAARSSKEESTPRDKSAAKNKPSYPCADCADAVPADYCHDCKAEYDRIEQQKFEQQTKRQRRAYKRRRERALYRRQKRECETCGAEFKKLRTDARYCSDTCRKRAHRKTRALVTDKRVLYASSRLSVTSINVFEGRILTLLKRRPAVFVNDLLPDNRTRAQYQALCAAAVNLERAGKIESWCYYFRTGKPGFKVVKRPGYEIDDSKDIPRLKAKERIRIGGGAP